MRGSVVALFLVAAIVGGCSAVREISDAAQEVQGRAAGIREDLKAASGTGEVGPAAQVHLDAADAKAVEIHDAAGAVIRAVPGVRDVTPLWYPVVKWGLVVLGVLGAFGACVYLNVGALARPVFSLIGGLIPTGTRAAAKFDAEAAAAGELSAAHDKSITARRVTDAAYEAAFLKAKRAAEMK